MTISATLPHTTEPGRSRITGKERDAESGNDYFGARYYSNAFGRWLSPDWSAKEEPIPYAKLNDPQSLNLYDYLGGNPTSGFDADGHAPGGMTGDEECALGAVSECVPKPSQQPSQAQQQNVEVAQEEAPESPEEAEQEREQNALEPLKPGEKVASPDGRVPGAIYPGEKGPLDPAHAKNFKWYITMELKSAETYYRQWGPPAGPEGKHGGTYYSFFPPEGSNDFMRQQMSLPGEWNSMEHTDAVTIPAGRTVYIGPAAAQAGYPGGGIQVFVPNP